MSSIGRRPNFSTQNRSSSTVSARCVCNLTPCLRARSAESRISSGVTEKGEQGATEIRHMEAGPGSWKAAITRSLSARMASWSSTTASGGRPPADWPSDIEPRQG